MNSEELVFSIKELRILILKKPTKRCFTNLERKFPNEQLILNYKSHQIENSVSKG